MLVCEEDLLMVKRVRNKIGLWRRPPRLLRNAPAVAGSLSAGRVPQGVVCAS